MGYGGANTCQGWRAPRTTTTLSWGDGDLGPCFVTFPDGSISLHEMKEMNELYQGRLHVECHQRRSHMWSGETCVKFFDFISTEIRRKRLALGYKDATQAPVMLICDRAPAHQSSVFQSLRKAWSVENNVILIGGDNGAECMVPSGFGATMQPNDRQGIEHYCLPLEVMMDLVLKHKMEKFLVNFRTIIPKKSMDTCYEMSCVHVCT